MSWGNVSGAYLFLPLMESHEKKVERRDDLIILFALDTSRSMLARDVKPDRLTYGKNIVRNLVQKWRGQSMGLIAFSGKAFLSCPPTTDDQAILLTLDALGPDAIPRGGTSLERAIQEALAVPQDEFPKQKVLLLFSDGEDHEGDPLAAAEAARQKGLKVFTIGIGTREGDLTPSPKKGR